MIAGDVLQGLRVLDLTQGIAGPYCTKLLAGLGADVIKVENPCKGDITRRIGPFPQDSAEPGTAGLLFLYLNTDKKSVTLNLKTPAGQTLLKRLVSSADVVVESYMPHTSVSLGLGYEVLIQANPSIVATSISNFGHDGPYRDYRATEIVHYALSGLMYITGEPEREPLMIGVEMAQFVAGQNGFAATLAAVLRKKLSGEGQHVDISIMECNAGILEFQLPIYLFQGKVPTRIGHANEKGHPHGMYPCKNGWVALQVHTEAGWPAVARLTGIKELSDPRFATDAGRIEHRDEVDAYLLPWLMERDQDEVVRAWEAGGVAASRSHRVDELLNLRQLRERGYFCNIDHPSTGEVSYPGGPFRIDGRYPCKNVRAPLLGEHNADIFGGQLGLAKEDLVRLKEAGAI